jgi:hypothetical protein
MWRSGGLKVQRMLVCAQPVFFSFSGYGATNVKLHIFYYICVMAARRLNLLAIENCICGLRSIGRKKRTIFRTVQAWEPVLVATELCVAHSNWATWEPVHGLRDNGEELTDLRTGLSGGEVVCCPWAGGRWVCGGLAAGVDSRSPQVGSPGASSPQAPYEQE